MQYHASLLVYQFRTILFIFFNEKKQRIKSRLLAAIKKVEQSKKENVKMIEKNEWGKKNTDEL